MTIGLDEAIMAAFFGMILGGLVVGVYSLLGLLRFLWQFIKRSAIRAWVDIKEWLAKQTQEANEKGEQK